jgi:hypothetical protein
MSYVIHCTVELLIYPVNLTPCPSPKGEGEKRSMVSILLT